jgi:serine/threonine protein kinase
MFRSFYIIVFELLDINLYKHIKALGFKGIGSDDLRSIATQLLNALSFLKRIGIVHCDLKPENILFTDETRKAVKIVDFGSSCSEFHLALSMFAAGSIGLLKL